ncbi:hypothetical protein VA596_17135 [Amycolatopsis sp., V23-08]|uniref:Uncharacterized protein n=1 Tax=Amycolatopsis heterodermiae TaxID=3110235 RepID=A0ABU5R4X9_9PSEU|nr:hypothetical protein [Amycolatopsis sp., V23-08]MEA5361272.1 hypothetical protein [Amycolatopsis sp., V23-08]
MPENTAETVEATVGALVLPRANRSGARNQALAGTRPRLSGVTLDTLGTPTVVTNGTFAL